MREMPAPNRDEILVPYKLRAIRIGVFATLLIGLVLLVYPFLPGAEDRIEDVARYWVIVVAAVAKVGIVAALPWRRIFSAGYGQWALVTWSAVDILSISYALTLTGGQRSEVFLLFALTTVFFAAVHPPKSQIALLLLTVTSYLGVVVLTDRPLLVASLMFRVSALGVFAFIAIFLSRELLRLMDQHREARLESERRATLLGVIASAARTMQSPRPDLVLDVVLDATTDLGFHASAIALLDEHEPRYRLNGARGALEPQQAGALDLDSRSLVGAATARRTGILLVDVHEVIEDDPALAGRGLATVACAPIVANGRLAAVLLAGLTDDRPLPPAAREALELLASQAARAIEQAGHAQRLRQSEERFRALAQHSSDLLLVLDDAGDVTYHSDSITTLLGLDSSAATSTRLRSLVHPDDAMLLSAAVGQAAPGAGPSRPVEVRMQDARNGEWRDIEVIANNLMHDPNVQGLVLNGRDITERKALAKELQHLALHDTLTGLPNRALFQDRLTAAVARRVEDGRSLAVLYVDLDDFKSVNDLLSHAAGDQLLAVTAQRIAGLLRPADTVARLGGDEFAILREVVAGEDEAVELADSLINVVTEPVAAPGGEASVGASVGIALHGPAAGGPVAGSPVTADELLSMADIALSAAKRDGKRRSRIFDEALHSMLIGHRELERDLRHAIERSEFELHYQPTVMLESGDVAGFEALIRWNHPTKGLIPPMSFIPIAEQSDLIVRIGTWVLDEACRQLADWRAEGLDDLVIAVNVSTRQLRDRDFPAETARCLARHGVPANRLVIEITETSLAEQVEQVRASLEQLRALRVRIAIDDFGTGYSSLGYLHDFPVDILKVDRSFIARVGEGEDAEALVAAIVELGRRLHLETVAEGIERDEHRTYLRGLGCILGQGYLFSRPMPAAALAAFLAPGAGRARPAA